MDLNELQRFTFKWKQEEILYTAEMSHYNNEIIYIVMWNKDGKPYSFVYSVKEVFERIELGYWNQIVVEEM